MEYTIYKDNKPEQTIEKIRGILNNLGIEVNETYKRHKENSVTSVRLTIKGSAKGTNGKGTTEQKALASAYAEFMERLQNNYLIKYTLNEKDQKEVPLSEIPDYFKSVMPKNLNGKLHRLINIKRAINQLQYGENPDNYSDETTACVPFYSLNRKENVDIPINELRFFHTTTGMAAGNTYEEAAVQAISELCERYCMKQILTRRLRMPTVPQKYYSSVETITKLIEFIENKGFKVTIKAANLGDKRDKSINIAPPVICAVFEQKDSNGENCQIRFGSHPYLYIAIERTLTEFMQGFQIENNEDRDYINIFRDIPSSDIETKLGDFYHSVVIFSKQNEHYSFLFSEEQDYEFNENDWILTDESSNKEMLEKISKIGKDVYIRNYSFLGFPAIDVFIPELMCYRNVNEELLDNEIRLAELERDILLGKPLNYTAEELLSICEYSLNEIYEHQISKVPLTYIAFLCALILKDEAKAEKFYQRMYRQINYNSKYGDKNYFTKNILLEYFNLKSQYKSEQEVFQKLYKLFENQFKGKYNIKPEEFDKQFFEKTYINTITINKVLNLISRNPNRQEVENLQNYKNILANRYINSIMVYNIL